jgi:predicted nucleotidyltransferase component of viral defense system
LISLQEIRKISRNRKIPVDLIEKDYVLGWILYGISTSSLGELVAFKGGTALSKVYFQGNWRISEDLDFTANQEVDMITIGTPLLYEVPQLVSRQSGINLELKGDPFKNEDYLQCRFGCNGPLSRVNVKVEISKEDYLGEVIRKSVPQQYDYPEFDTRVYSLDNLFTEKMRSLFQRTKIRDYYDVWRLLKTQGFDKTEIRKAFLKKCETKNINLERFDNIFSDQKITELRPYYQNEITRFTAEPLPILEEMLKELKTMMVQLLHGESGSQMQTK